MLSRKVPRARFHRKARSSAVKKINFQDVQLNRTVKKVIAFIIFIMIIFIVLTTFILFYTFNFTRILKSTDQVINSRIDKTKQKLENNINFINSRWDKIKEEEVNFLSINDLIDFKKMQERLNPSRFIDLSRMIEEEELKFREWYKSETADFDLFNLSTTVYEISNSKATEADVNEWFKDNYDNIIADGKEYIHNAFKGKAVISDLEKYNQEFLNRKSLVDNFLKKIESYPNFNLSLSFVNTLFEPILRVNQEWWDKLYFEQIKVNKILYPPGYIYIQPAGQLKPEHIFYPTQFQMFPEEPDSEFYLENFDTFFVPNVSLRVYLWRRG